MDRRQPRRFPLAELSENVFERETPASQTETVMATKRAISPAKNQSFDTSIAHASSNERDGPTVPQNRAAPVSGRSTIEKQGERAYSGSGATATIQFAAHQGAWIAEFRFRLRSGLYQGCTLPLTTSSERLASPAQAIGGAARRMLESLAMSIEGAELTASQRAAVADLQTWAQELIDAATAQTSGPLAGARFLDVFAGIGGFHVALSSLGAFCAGAIEIDEKARETYRANHLGDYPIAPDIRTARASEFGRVDIVCGGFPCQSFSRAGNGAGFTARDKGALFFDLARLIGELAPSVAILENVVGLAQHDDGRTLDTVIDTLAGLGYSVSTRLLNAGEFGLAQMRGRLFLVCIHDSILANRAAPFVFPTGADASKVVADILDPNGAPVPCSRPMDRFKRDPKDRSARIETVGLIDGKAHQGYRVASPLGKGFTLCANSGGAGGRTGLYLVNGKPRTLSARECARMQGFPESFSPHSRPAVALKQFGNSVAVPIARALSASLQPAIDRGRSRKQKAGPFRQ